MDKFHSWEVGAAEDDSCEKCGMNTSKSSGCCRDEIKTLKLQQDLSPVSFVVYQFALPGLVSPNSSYFILKPFNTNLVKDYLSHSPPLVVATDAYILNCVFRI